MKKTSELLKSIIKLVLQSDDESSNWVDNPALLNCAYLLCFWILLMIIFMISSGLFIDHLRTSVLLTLVYRVIYLILWLSVAIIIILTSYYYYLHILNNMRNISIEYIIWFYLMITGAYAHIYIAIYLLFPSSFICNPPIFISKTYIFFPFVDKLHFILFSAFQSVNGSYYRIHPNSAISSLLSYFQSIYTIVLISLFISSYVNQNTKK